MRVAYYRRLSEPEGGARAAAWAWAALRRAAAGVARLYAARRRRSARRLWGGRVVAARRAKRGAAGREYLYDPASYARNFDDGTWMAEEGVSRAGTHGPSPPSDSQELPFHLCYVN